MLERGACVGPRHERDDEGGPDERRQHVPRAGGAGAIRGQGGAEEHVRVQLRGGSSGKLNFTINFK